MLGHPSNGERVNTSCARRISDRTAVRGQLNDPRRSRGSCRPNLCPATGATIAVMLWAPGVAGHSSAREIVDIAVATPYLTLMDEAARQRRYELREMFNALCWIVPAGAPWRMTPENFPPWAPVCQRTQRWLQAGCLQNMVCDLRSIIRVAH